MTTLISYAAQGGQRQLTVIERPDRPGRLMLLDAPAGGASTDDVHVVDDELTTLAEARIVARGWVAEHATTPPTSTATEPQGVTQPAGARCVLALYRTPNGQRSSSPSGSPAASA